MSSENMIICNGSTKIDESSFVGKNPPEDIMVIAKLRELKDRTLKIFRIIKITIVIPEYNKKILVVCLNTSELLNDKKLVKDFFKLSS
jgi:hypothetical protein